MIIGICASPRNGNSLWMLQKAANAITKNDGLIEIIHLKDYQIDWCDGCLTCEETGICKIKDDMGHLIEKLKASDTIIISTPVYFNSVPCKLKCFIDRLNPLLLHDELNGKKLVVFIVGQLTGKDGEESRDDVKNFFSTLSDICNMDLIGIVEAEGRLEKDLENNKQVAFQCEDIVKKLIINKG